MNVPAGINLETYRDNTPSSVILPTEIMFALRVAAIGEVGSAYVPPHCTDELWTHSPSGIDCYRTESLCLGDYGWQRPQYSVDEIWFDITGRAFQTKPSTEILVRIVFKFCACWTLHRYLHETNRI